MVREKDKIMRKTLARPSPALIKNMLSLNVEKVIPMPPTVRQTILEREADTLLEVNMSGEMPFILHWEYQSTNDAKMPIRMAIYDYLIYEELKMDVKSAVIYIGQESLNMKSKISFFDNIYSCDIIDIRKFDPEIFLQSTVYKEVILALLAGPDNEIQKAVIIRKILIRLREVFRLSDLEFIEKIKEMEYLAQLRGKHIQQLILKEVQNMPVILDPRKSLFYIQGKEEGKAEGKIEDAINFIKEGVALAIINRSTGITMEELMKIKKKVMSDANDML